MLTRKTQDLVEIEEWNEYGELKQHVSIYYDEHTIPPISQAPKELPKPKPAVTPAAAVAAAAGAAAAAAAAAAKSEDKPKAVEHAKPAPPPIQSIADEAAKKAKELHLQSLRKKVADAAAARKPDEKDAEAEAEPVADPTDPEPAEETSAVELGVAALSISDPAAAETKAPGLQSPTSGAWKDATSDATSDAVALREILQSPTSSAWKPADISPPMTTLHGAPLVSASEEEIAAVEKEETIEEVPEEDEEDNTDAKAKKTAEKKGAVAEKS